MAAEPGASVHAGPPGRAELSELLRRSGLHPSRALGQNFLADPNVARRIARLARVGPGDEVLEVGAGLGSLTSALAATGASVLAVELDSALATVLRERVGGEGVRVVEADAMTLDWESLLGESEWVLVANLPYNIATPLLVQIVRRVAAVRRMLVMVQREVGERLAARPGEAAHGAPSVRLAYFAEVRLVGRVPASVFLPRPKVESVLVEVVRRAEPAVAGEAASYEEIDRLVAAGYSKRRKMLRGSLAGLVGEEVFEAAGVEPTARPEELGIADWGRLAAARSVRGAPERAGA